MKPVQYTVRLPAVLDAAMRELAARQGVTAYAMLQQSVRAGIAAQSEAPSPATAERELVAELVSIGTRLAELERMIDRTLFTACAAYCYARSAGVGGKSDEALLAEVHRAYDRQRAIAEARS